MSYEFVFLSIVIICNQSTYYWIGLWNIQSLRWSVSSVGDLLRLSIATIIDFEIIEQFWLN